LVDSGFAPEAIVRDAPSPSFVRGLTSLSHYREVIDRAQAAHHVSLSALRPFANKPGKVWIARK
jgi:hypothetical protein